MAEIHCNYYQPHQHLQPDRLRFWADTTDTEADIVADLPTSHRTGWQAREDFSAKHSQASRPQAEALSLFFLPNQT